MKTLIFLIVVVAATIQSVSAQEENENKSKTLYSIEFAQFNSGSGFQGGYEVHLNVQPSTKATVSFGIFIDKESKKFSGITITHKRMLLAEKTKASKIRPYIFYNFIYRKTNIPELTASDISNSSADLVTYTSMEHHLGLGFQVKVSNLISLNGGVAYGLYLGSIKRPSQPNPITREITGTSGGAILAKVGFAINL
jgi:hypothetical protein